MPCTWYCNDTLIAVSLLFTSIKAYHSVNTITSPASKPVATKGWLGAVTPPRGNVNRQICNLTQQINEVSLGSALTFRELGLASSSFLLKNLGKAIWSVSEGLDLTIFLGQSNQGGLPSWPTWHITPPHPPPPTPEVGAPSTRLCLLQSRNFKYKRNSATNERKGLIWFQQRFCVKGKNLLRNFLQLITL